jgi:hypothetical protein
MLWKLWKKHKLNSEMIWKTRKKSKLLLYFPYHFTIFFCIFQIFSLFNLGFFHIFPIFSLFNLLFLCIFHLFSHFNLLFFRVFHIISLFNLCFFKKDKFNSEMIWKIWKEIVKRYEKSWRNPSWMQGDRSKARVVTLT